ncbi:hypothetical protein Cs7R123_32480 [Catellatospora sp. TT07R-123]|uniref:GOLPH3/VPS74 family protein n=1 Tax=Catellatospora sp. TT07R-123 TaxID=2733863 RepID=UPI001B1785BF|nr:GPP34 family phosphoprotein [Catellatospora sp. TT07R-123]GHJ45906.1 hypothetical protein Cs7R123_32480 [Catellatospora sp. TT07R-123]
MIADDFFRIAHHDVTGKPRLHSRAVAIGLAASLLGELLAERRITLADGQLTITDRTPPSDSLTHAVLDQLVDEPRQHTMQTWLAFLSQQATAQVAGRLQRAGHVRAEAGRRLLRTAGTVWVPTDMNTAAKPWALLSNQLRRHGPLDYHQLCLAGLCHVTGLDSYVIEGAPPATYEHMRNQIGTLWPPMQDLLHHTRTAIGNAVLAHRT